VTQAFVIENSVVSHVSRHYLHHHVRHYLRAKLP